MRHKILLFFIFMVAGAFFFKDINKPFFGLHENNSVLFSIYAKNILENGLLASKACGTSYVGHPCLLQVLLAFFYRIGGITDSVGRILPILASLGSLYLVYLLGKKLFNPAVGLVSAAVMVFLPSFITFGDMISHEMSLLFFGLAGLFFFIKWKQKKKNLDFLLTIISLVFASLIDWPGFYLWGIMVIYSFFQKEKKYFVFLAMAGLLTAMLLLAHLFWVSNGDIQAMFSTYQRLFINRAQAIDGGASSLLSKVYFREKLLFTPEIILLAFLGLIVSRSVFLLILFLFALIHVLVFRGGWYQHFYWSYYFIPFLSISSGCFISLVIKKWGKVALFLALLLFIFYVKISLRNVAYFDSLYDKNLEAGINQLNRQTQGEKVFLLTHNYSTLVLQYYLRGGFIAVDRVEDVQPEKANWAVAWILPDTSVKENELISDVCHTYNCQTIVGEGNYPLFKLARLQ